MSLQWFEKIKEPLSLRWKWSIILFICFSGLTLLSAVSYTYYTIHQQQLLYQQRNEQLVQDVDSYLSSFGLTVEREIIAANRSDHLDRSTNAHHFDHLRTMLEPSDARINLYTVDGRTVYQTISKRLPELQDSSELLYNETIDGWVNHQNIYGRESGNRVGSFTLYIPSFRPFYDLKPLLWLALLFMLLSLPLAILISHIFLKPLSYLNSVLDLIEEENLSQIRMRQPSSDDEWSDLNVHINRLLDRIDLYVRNQKQFVEDVSHELRTPVAIVEGHLKLLTRWGKDDPEILEESIDASLQEMLRMKVLIQEMLDLSRADHVDVDYKDEVTEIYTTTAQVFSNFKVLHPEFEFYFDSENANHELFVRMFRNHYEQILIILMDNAVKYSLDRKEVHIALSSSFTHVEIAIQDFGEGMTEEDKERVFSRFYRVDKARSREKGGTGLGLSIAKQLVETYKGHIRVESSLGHGSIFYIELPLITDEEQIKQSKEKILQQHDQLYE